MLPPAAMSFSALVATTGLLFVIWHTWHYDRWRCLLYSRQEWFRALMCQILLISVLCLMAYSWLELHVLYEEYYVFLGQSVVPAPWQLWSDEHQTMWRASLYVLCTGWCFIQAVHLEEFLYWGYLMNGVRTSGGPKTSWFRSIFFKTWLAASLSSMALLFGAVHIETDNLGMMRTYLFLVGSAVSVVLAGASTVLCLVFPRFVDNVRRQGATYEVLERLHFFAEMNQIRTAFRWIYSVCFLTLSIDGLTDAMKVNMSGFWSDMLYLSGHLSIFASACLSVVVLLPRNMTSESLPPSRDTTIHPMVPYKRPKELIISSGGAAPEMSSPRQYYEIGDRLNIDREAMASGLAHSDTSEAYELKHSPKAGVTAAGSKGVQYRQSSEAALPHPYSNTSPDAGHAMHSEVAVGSPSFLFATNSPRRSKRFSEMPSLPAVMARFRSPFETAPPGLPGSEGTRVYVTTHQTVERE